MMQKRKNLIKKRAISFLALCVAGFWASSVCSVQAAQNQTSAANLQNIARDFVQKLSPVYTPEKKRSEIDQIPDGATLLLRPRSQRVNYEDEIYAIKKDGTVYLAFEDVINILEFAITFSEEGNYAEGWFLREDWELKFNRAEKEILARGFNYNIETEDLYDQDGILFVRGESLGKWLGLEFDYNISEQLVNIDSPYPLPAVARNLRERRSNDIYSSSDKPAELPRIDHDPAMFDLNTADVTLSTDYQKSASGVTSSTERASVAAEGEILGHNAYVFASGDSNEQLTNVVTRFEKRSEDTDLLGPLKARSYAFGDVDLTDVPLTGSVSRDFGFRFDNNPLENNDFAETDIEGDGLPGWDVELYRNGVLIDTLTIEQDGRYRFSDIELFIGENDFELYFYGPQGEIRFEDLSVPVSRELLASQNKTYEVSVSLEDTQTFQKRFSDEDEGAVQVAGRYNRMIGENALGYVGLRSRQINEDRRTIVSSGLSTIIGNTLLDTNVAADQEGNVAGEAIIRRKISDWDTSFRARASTEEFINSDFADPQVLDLSFNAQKNFPRYSWFNGNILTNARYQELASGSTLQNFDFGISQRLQGANISNRIVYEDNEISNGTNNERLDHVLSVRKAFHKFFLRAGSTYRFKPESELSNLIGQVNYLRNENFSADLTVERQFANDLDLVRLNANITNDYFRTSPFIRIDTDDQILAGVSVNFNLTDTPGQVMPEIGPRRTIGRGMVSVFVYHDKNGNYIFDGADVPIPEAIVQSLNVRRREVTDERGYALIRDLQTTRPTDIVVQQEELPDPFLVVASKGRSVLPTAGSLYELEFPLHTSGEIEGNTLVKDSDGETRTLSYQRVQLLSVDDPERKPIKVRSERDGFYLSYLVPPGRYLVVPEVPESKADRLANQLPPIVDIGYDGTILKNVDVVLEKEGAYVPYNVSFVSEAAALSHKITHPTLVMRVKEGGQSKLSSLLGKLLSNRVAADILSTVSSVSLGDEVMDNVPAGVNFYTDRNQDPEFMHNQCMTLNMREIDCEMVMLVPLISAQEDVIAQR